METPPFRNYAVMKEEARSGSLVALSVPYQDTEIPITFTLDAYGEPTVEVADDVNWHITTVPLSHKAAWDVTICVGPKSRHGGIRPGAGRPPQNVKKVKRAVSLSPEADAYVMSQQRPAEAYSAALDRILIERGRLALVAAYA